MNCQKYKIEIEERNPGREFLSDAAEAHLASCAACRRFAEERLALRRLIGGLEKISAPADFDFRLRARIAAERSAGERRAARFNFSPAALSWPLAACLVLVVSVSLYFQARRPDAPRAINATPSAEQTRAAAPATPATANTAGTAQISGEGNAPQGLRVLNDEAGAGINVASRNVSRSSSLQRRTEPSRFASRGVVERAREAQVEESASMSLRGSTPRFASHMLPRTEGAPIPVQLDAPEGQLKVLLRDTSGEARTISVDSVSFGSRDVVTRRPGATYAKASLSSNQGVW